MSRLVVVSNRVAPIQEGEPTAGGLAAGVLDALKQQGGIWFGWSGEIAAASDAQPGAHRRRRSRSTPSICRAATTTSSTAASPTARCGRCCITRSASAASTGREFAGYRRVNALFAHALAQLVRPDDLVWAHDYHLLCLAEALRAAGVTNRIGLFLHTPFPAPAVFMTIPSHAELIRAMCAFDLLGFQTETDRTAFSDYVVRQAGGKAMRDGTLHVFGRSVKTGVFPIGVHVDEVRAQAEDPANRRFATRLRANLLERLILSVDRLDYSKGLRQRFAAFERFLEEYPAPPRQRHVHADRAAVALRRRRPIAKSAASWKARPAASTAASPKSTGCRCAI